MGGLLFLLPGLAAADRWLRGMPGRLGWAPVLSFTLLPLSAVLLDFLVDLDVRTANTLILAVVLAGVIGRPRLVAWMARWRGGPRLRRNANGRAMAARIPPATWVGLVLVFVVLGVAHGLPHLPGSAPTAPAQVPRAVLERAQDAMAGSDEPYPVHVDEHLHLANMALLDRTGEVEIPHPYTGDERPLDLFTVGGLRSERGWHVAIVQFHQATGTSLMTLAHYLPALWSAYLGCALWLTLRPAPGALAAAACTAVLPSTLRFLGPGFLVPSGFALPWILAVVAVAHRASGPGRLIALAALITGGFIMHIVPGTLALVAGLLTVCLRPESWQNRLGSAAAIALPLVWIVPSTWDDVVANVTILNGLPFQPSIFLSTGPWFLGAAVAGTMWAWWAPSGGAVPHRALSILVVGLMASMAWSMDALHTNDATYGRLIQPFFLCLAGLAGTAIGALAQALANRLAWRRLRPWVLVVLLTGVGVPAVTVTALQNRLNEPYYRVFDAPSWDSLEAFAKTPGTEGRVFLTHPWQAPLFNAVSGGIPDTYLLPGGPPVNRDDWDHYIVSGGADEQWLRERAITFVIAPVPPQAPHSVLGPNLYQVHDAVPA